MRIIAGKYAKRNLHTLKSNATRPTSDKVKGSLFNSLGQFFDGGQVLDLYAGSGALGIEAVSRGYDGAVLVDISGQACQVIKKNVELTKEEERFRVLKCSDNRAIKILQDEGKKFDLVFLDPPYATTYGEQAMQSILKHKIIKNDGILIFEHSKGKTFDYSGYDLVDKKSYGIKEVSYFKVHND